MSAITINTSVHGSAPFVVDAITRAIKPERINPVLGSAITKKFIAHFRARDRSSPNALGGARTHFWANAARSTQFTVMPDGVMISVNAIGVRQHVLGGTIKPRNAQYLTIPARAEAYGKRASAFKDLIILRRGDHQFGEPYALARPVRTTLKFTGAATSQVLGAKRVSAGALDGGEIMFWLKKSVTQRPDPEAVPTTFEIAATAQSTINAHVDTAVRRAEQAAAQEGKSP